MLQSWAKCRLQRKNAIGTYATRRVLEFGTCLAGKEARLATFVIYAGSSIHALIEA
jgi:hypothetical protein